MLHHKIAALQRKIESIEKNADEKPCVNKEVIINLTQAALLACWLKRQIEQKDYQYNSESSAVSCTLIV